LIDGPMLVQLVRRAQSAGIKGWRGGT
jgi:hypothetical protein